MSDEFTPSSPHDSIGKRSEATHSRDQTAGRQAKAALKQTKERLERAEAHAGLGSWELEVNTQQGYWSKEMFRLFGFEPAGAAPPFETYLERIHPEDRSFVHEALQRMSAGKEPAAYIFRTNPEHLPLRYFRPTWHCVRDGEGRPLRFEGTILDITEHKHVEEALRQSEERTRLIVQNALDANVTMNDEGVITAWNPQAETIFGWSSKEVIGQLLTDTIVPPKYREAHRRGLQQFLATGAGPLLNKRIEIVALHRNGHEFPVELAVTPIKIGESFVFSGFVRDITERKQAQEELEQSKALLEIAGDAARLGGWVVDLSTDRVIWSDIVCAIHEEPLGTSPTVAEGISYYAPEWRPKIRAAYEACVRDGTPFDEEVEIITAKGRCVWVRTIGRAVRRAGGAITQVQGAFQDISQQKEAKKQITQIMHSVPDGVVLLNRQHQILLANPAAQNYLALLAGAEVGDTLTWLGDRPLKALLTPPPVGRWHEVQAGKVIFEFTGRQLATGPTPSGWVLVLRDVTEQQMVQRQLQQQEQLAAVGQLAAGIAHDFNNLMSVIVLYTQLVAASPGLSEQDQKRLATINHQAEQAAGVIQQILDFSRRSVLERQVLDLLPLLEEQIRLLQHILPEHIEIILMDGVGEYLVQVDPTHLQQVIMNLAINARDAMPQGGRLTFHLDHFRVEPGQAPPLPDISPGAWIRLTVADTGAGISPKHLNHIFEPFFTTKGPGEGSGLGLAQVHGIVAQHAGQITVASQVGEGTTFRLYLPALLTPGEDPATVVETSLPQGNGELVLVVEDNEALRAALANYLQTWFYRTLEAGNGEEALACLSEQGDEVAVVLSDVVMPRMGGVELFYALRQQEREIPVILMTGRPLKEEELAALQVQGLHAWLPKPPDLTHLAQTIASALPGDCT